MTTTNDKPSKGTEAGMSKTVKSRAKGTTAIVPDEVIEPPHGNKGNSVKYLNEMYVTLETSTKTFIQGSVQYQEMLAEYAREAALHNAAYGDARPMDRLVKLLFKDAHTKTFALEIVAWCRTYTPIRWDAQQKVMLERDAKGKVKPTNEEKVKAEDFFQLEQVKDSRKAAGRAAAAKLEPVTIKDILGRIHGLRKFIQSANEPNREGHVRGIAKGDLPKIRKIVDAVEESVHEVVGELYVPEAKEVEARSQKRKAA